MKDRFDTRSANIIGSALDGFAIAASDIGELTETTRAIYVGSPGDLTIVLKSNAELTFKNVAASTVLPVRAIKVLATGTTASDLLGLV